MTAFSSFFFSPPGVVCVCSAGGFFVLLSGVFWRRRDRSLFHVSVFPSLLVCGLVHASFHVYIYLLFTSHPRRPLGMHASSSPFPRDTHLTQFTRYLTGLTPSNPSLMKIEHFDDILINTNFKDIISLADIVCGLSQILRYCTSRGCGSTKGSTEDGN